MAKNIRLLEKSKKWTELFLLCFSLITHGFGTPAICAALSTFQTILSEMLNYLEKHSANKSTGTPDGNQINSNSDKTLRKTSEAPTKDGKIEKIEWLWSCVFLMFRVRLWRVESKGFYSIFLYLYNWPQLSPYDSLPLCRSQTHHSHCSIFSPTQPFFLLSFYNLFKNLFCFWFVCM